HDLIQAEVLLVAGVFAQRSRQEDALAVREGHLALAPRDRPQDQPLLRERGEVILEDALDPVQREPGRGGSARAGAEAAEEWGVAGWRVGRAGAVSGFRERMERIGPPQSAPSAP